MISGSHPEDSILPAGEPSEGDEDYYLLPRPKRGRLHEAILEDPVSQLNAPRPIICNKTDRVARAVERMRKLRYGSVLVVDEGKLVGIFTEHDLVAHFAGREDDLSRRTLGEVMTPNPQSIRKDDNLSYALNCMACGGYRHIPVVEDERPVGFISVRGILAYLHENALAPRS